MNFTGQILDILYEESKKTLGNVVQYGRKELEAKLDMILSDDDFDSAISELIKYKLINVLPPIGKQTFTIYKISHKGFVGIEKFKASNENWHKFMAVTNELAENGKGFFDKSLIDEVEKAKRNWQLSCNDFSNWLILNKEFA